MTQTIEQLSPAQGKSIGYVETRSMTIDLPGEGFVLDSGESLPALDVAYETYGELSPECDNAVYICHALTMDAHAAGYHEGDPPQPGWWEEMIGPGKGIDTDRHFVICANILGGCRGTTGPMSVNPATGKSFGSSFPTITVGDIVHLQYLAVRQLGVKRLRAVVGGSLGGMQVLEWSIRYPAMVEKCLCLASGASLTSQALAFDVVGRAAIMSDKGWAGGDYYEAGTAPENGLAQARMLAHITYLSPEIMKARFGREKELAANPGEPMRFQVESYLKHQGLKFISRFDANSYLSITHAMDSYDLSDAHGSLEEAFADVQSQFLVVALSSDWLFPPQQSIEMAQALLRAGKEVSYCLLRAPYGHDAFLVDVEPVTKVVRTFLGCEPPRTRDAGSSAIPRRDYQLIRDAVQPGARVLDLGCGDGELLATLAAEKGIHGLGMDYDLDQILLTMANGPSIFQADLDEGLAMIPDRTYDYAILSQTLQVVHRPRLVLREMLRVAREGIISFPNSAQWSNRLHLVLRGRMPVSEDEECSWYNTPNIHMATLSDFMALCREEGIRIVDTVYMPDGWVGRLLMGLGMPNAGAAHVYVRITRDEPA